MLANLEVLNFITDALCRLYFSIKNAFIYSPYNQSKFVINTENFS